MIDRIITAGRNGNVAGNVYIACHILARVAAYFGGVLQYAFPAVMLRGERTRAVYC